MDISELVYELYKIDWMRRISPERQMQVVKEYYAEQEGFFDEDSEDFYEEYSLNDYIFEHGYDGELYVCYYEFLREEYMDAEFVRYLLNDECLFGVYMKDVERIKRWMLKELS